jgi:hypothetical protein
MRNGIAIVVEGLHTGLIGAYGSNTAVTQAMDRMAAHGLVLDQCFLDSFDLALQLRSLWTGFHASQQAKDVRTMWHKVSECGMHGCLITDCSMVARIAEELGCPRVVLVDTASHDQPASDWTECALMQVFVAAVEEIEATQSDTLIWVHSRGLRLAWDAPLEFRQRFTDPEDPDPPGESCVPDIVIDRHTDPDQIVGWAQVAAAQVAVVDRALEVVLATVEARADALQWSSMLVSLGGVPLGEHGRLGWGEPQLYGEEVNCLAIVRPAHWSHLGQRRAELCQLPDLLPTWLDALKVQSDQPSVGWGRSLLGLGPFTAPFQWPAYFQAAYMIDKTGTHWLRTPAWSSLLHQDEKRCLYVKPDDRWEVSDVATRRIELVDELQELAATFAKCLHDNTREQLPQLSAELCNLIR